MSQFGRNPVAAPAVGHDLSVIGHALHCLAHGVAGSVDLLGNVYWAGAPPRCWSTRHAAPSRIKNQSSRRTDMMSSLSTMGRLDPFGLTGPHDNRSDAGSGRHRYHRRRVVKGLAARGVPVRAGRGAGAAHREGTDGVRRDLDDRPVGVLRAELQRGELGGFDPQRRAGAAGR